MMEAKIGKAIAEKGSLEGAAALYVSRESLRTLLTPVEINALTHRGRLCAVERIVAGEDDLSGEVRRLAALCPVPEAMRKQLPPKGVIATRAFLAATGLREGDRVRISLEAEWLAPEAEEIVAEEHNTPEHYSSPPLPEDIPHWEWNLLQCLRELALLPSPDVV